MEKLYSENLENREHQADLLLKFLNTNKNIDTLNKQEFKNIFSDEKNKREFIENLTIDNFTELLNSLNGILRNKNKEQWEIDGKNVRIASERMTSYIPPEENDKKELLVKVFETAKKMNQEKRSLEDIALLISANINALHLYNDANGRMSRFIYTILTEKNNENLTDKLKEVLSNDGKDKINISTGHIMRDIEKKIEETINTNSIDNLHHESNIESLNFPPNTDKKDQELFLKLMTDTKNNLKLSILLFLHDNPQIDIEQVSKKLSKTNFISLDYLMKNINSEDIKKILNNYKNLKKEKVLRLIDLINNPDTDENQTETDGNKISMKQLFENRIKKEQQK